MSNTYIDEKSIIAKVDKELKKCGTFDKIRRQATEHIKESEQVQNLEKEMLAKADEIMESSSSSSKKELQRRMREYVENSFKMRNDINRQTQSELDKEWVQEILKKEVEEKVKKQLEDLV